VKHPFFFSPFSSATPELAPQKFFIQCRGRFLRERWSIVVCPRFSPPASTRPQCSGSVWGNHLFALELTKAPQQFTVVTLTTCATHHFVLSPETCFFPLSFRRRAVKLMRGPNLTKTRRGCFRPHLLIARFQVKKKALFGRIVIRVPTPLSLGGGVTLFSHRNTPPRTPEPSFLPMIEKPLWHFFFHKLSICRLNTVVQFIGQFCFFSSG